MAALNQPAVVAQATAVPATVDGVPMSARRVLMVCTGNVCRSPMATVLWRERFGDHAMLVGSAGLNALTGYGIDPDAEAVLAEHGLSGKPHVARQLTANLVDAADIVLVMQRDQVAAVQALSPRAGGCTFLLGMWSGDLEIPDPHRRPRSEFVRAYRMIEQAVGDWRAHLDGVHA